MKMPPEDLGGGGQAGGGAGRDEDQVPSGPGAFISGLVCLSVLPIYMFLIRKPRLW